MSHFKILTAETISARHFSLSHRCSVDSSCRLTLSRSIVSAMVKAISAANTCRALGRESCQTKSLTVSAVSDVRWVNSALRSGFGLTPAGLQSRFHPGCEHPPSHGHLPRQLSPDSGQRRKWRGLDSGGCFECKWLPEHPNAARNDSRCKSGLTPSSGHPGIGAPCHTHTHTVRLA